MKRKKAVFREDAEAAFSKCASCLFDGRGKAAYKSGEADLSLDSRRLALFLLSRHIFPGCPLPVLPEWKSVVRLAMDLDKKKTAGLSEHFPALREGFDPDALIDAPILSEMGFYYERLKDCMAELTNGKVRLRSSRHTRKRRGTFFTPLSISMFMVGRVLDPVIEKLGEDPDDVLSVRVLDPSMGAGQFLLAACERLVKASAPDGLSRVLSMRRRIIDSSLFGIDLDAENVEVARFLFGLYAGRSDRTAPGLMKGDALVEFSESGQVFGEDGFPEKLFSGRGGTGFNGFDAIVGNPPYLAAKNESMAKYKPYLGKASQLDTYLLFIHKYAARKYIRPGGGICFIVPDPMLLRANAEEARYRLLEDLDLEFLLHIKGVFPGRKVANAVFLARHPLDGEVESVEAARIETAAHARSFRSRGAKYLDKIVRRIPKEYFRSAPRKEIRYLLTGEARSVLAHLDTGRPLSAKGSGIVIRPLRALARTKGTIFRGEEVGKDRLRSMLTKNPEEGIPVLIGGENISRYSVRNDGLYIRADQVKKDRARYMRHKILMQKSTGRIVAALDVKGHVVPQSVYGLLIDDQRIGYPFLLAQLNSRLLSYFMHVMFTGYKLVQPQIEIEDIHRIPVMMPVFDESRETRTLSLETAKSLFAQYIRTDDPGWILEYVDEYIKAGTGHGSAMVHDLVDFLGSQMHTAVSDPGKSPLPASRIEWLVDLVIYRVFGLGLEEIETVESHFGEAEAEGEGETQNQSADAGDSSRQCSADAGDTRQVVGPRPPVFGEREEEGIV